jgi:hypothetical protein
MISRIVVTTVGLIALGAGAPAVAQQGPLEDPIPAPVPLSPIRVSLTPVATGLTSPIFLTVVGDRDNRKFIVDQTGVVLLMKGGAIRPTPFLDISGILDLLSPAFTGAPQGLNPRYDERGLLGLAFHPDFNDRDRPGYHTLYTLHNVPVTTRADFPEPPFPDASVMPNCQEVVAEWKVSRRNPDVVNHDSYREILRFDRPQFNHNGGTVAFGPDGNLYASIGDGGAANDVGTGHNPTTGNAQDLSTILGKVIRINPLDPRLTRKRDGAIGDNGQYRIPRDNPFFNRSGSVREIYAYGLRNPFRMSFDRHSGHLVLADVGQNNIEEVDIITRGGNYGWHLKEGTFLFDPQTGNVFTDPHPDPRSINPVVEYDHDDFEANGPAPVAIIGGFVYRGSRIPELKGKYICADFTGVLFVADLEAGKLEKLVPSVGIFIKGIGQDASNELYVLGSKDQGPSGSNGMILAIQSIRAAVHGVEGDGGR